MLLVSLRRPRVPLAGKHSLLWVLYVQGFSRIASNPVQVNFTLTVPPVALRLPLASDPNLLTTVSPPIAHWGPGPVHMRLLSYELREGQVRVQTSDTGSEQNQNQTNRFRR